MWNNQTRGLKPRWKPGQSGNPKGRPPKKDCLTSLLKDELERIDPEDKQKRTWKELVVLATLRLAIKGHPTALKEVWERSDGKVSVAAQAESKSVVVHKVIVEYQDGPRRLDSGHSDELSGKKETV